MQVTAKKNIDYHGICSNKHPTIDWPYFTSLKANLYEPQGRAEPICYMNSRILGL